jgi:hypothetical protein
MCSTSASRRYSDEERGTDTVIRTQLAEYPLYVKANIYRERGKITESLMLFQKAARLNPHNVDNMKQVPISAPRVCLVSSLNPVVSAQWPTKDKVHYEHRHSEVFEVVVGAIKVL